MQLSMVREQRYVAAQTDFCRSPAGQAQMHFNKLACFYRPMDEPAHGWVGSYPSGSMGMGVDTGALSFSCALGRTNPALTRCSVGYRLKPVLDLRLVWIDVSYDVTLAPNSRSELIDQVMAYDAAIRAGLAAAAIANYPWPAASLAKWKAAQPTEAWLRELGTPIGTISH